MGDLVKRNELALLDRSDVRRTLIEPEALYAVSVEGHSAIRRLRRGTACLYLMSEDARKDPRRWQRLTLTGRPVTDLVRAKVIRLSAEPDWE